MVYWPNYLIVLSTAFLACVSVQVAYVVWIRLVGLEPTVAKRAVELSRHRRGTLTIAIGLVLGSTLQCVPTLRAGLALATMFATSAFGGSSSSST